jgi:hypothetical protein
VEIVDPQAFHLAPRVAVEILGPPVRLRDPSVGTNEQDGVTGVIEHQAEPGLAAGQGDPGPGDVLTPQPEADAQQGEEQDEEGAGRSPGVAPGGLQGLVPVDLHDEAPSRALDGPNRRQDDRAAVVPERPEGLPSLERRGGGQALGLHGAAQAVEPATQR